MLRHRVIAWSLLLPLVASGGAPPRQYQGVRPGSKRGLLALRPGRYEFTRLACTDGPPSNRVFWSHFQLDVGADGVHTLTVVSKRAARSDLCFPAIGDLQWTSETSWTARADAGSDVFFPVDGKEEPFRLGCDVTEVTVHSPDVGFEVPKGAKECADWQLIPESTSTRRLTGLRCVAQLDRQNGTLLFRGSDAGTEVVADIGECGLGEAVRLSPRPR
jgi:hypothetical protein